MATRSIEGRTERRRAGRPWADRRAPLRIAVFTTSYPTGPEDVGGRFVADAVERLRGEQIDVTVVHPHLRGTGTLVAKLKRAPWRAPSFLVRAVWALRRTDCDLVHAHWLLSGLV